MGYKLKDHITPYPYQVEGAKFALSHFYTLNRDEPGMGKTLQALLAAIEILNKNPGKKVLVIAPQYLRKNWESEVEETTEGFSVNLWDHKIQDEVFADDIVVMSYHQVRQYWEKLKYDKFDFVVIDEAHNFKNPKAKQTLGLLNLVKHLKPERLLLLSGTPIKNRLPDLFIPLYLLSMSEEVKNPITKKYRSYFTFCYNFCKVVRTPFGTKFVGEKNIDELQEYLVGRVIGREKKNVIELPEVISKFVTVDYKESPELLREYEAFNGVVQSAESSAKAESARLKAKFTAEYVRDLLEQDVGPVIIFTDHLAPIPIIREELKEYRVESIQGGITEKKREDIKKRFQSGDIDVLVATIGSFNSGVTLTRSSNLVFNDVCWVPSDLQQAIDRIHRIGQLNKCIIHYVVGAVVDKAVLRAIRAKLNTIRKVWNAN